MTSSHAPVLPGMFGPDLPKQHKSARQTSREVYRIRRSEHKAAAALGRETRQAAVLRHLAHFWNRYQFSPTSYELFQFALEHGEKRFRDIAGWRPRLTSLHSEGLIETRQKRACRVTGADAVTWAIREIGSKEARP